MNDPEIDLDELIFMLFERQHELRLRIRRIRPDAEADWESLHEQLNLLNDRRIELAWRREVAIEEWATLTNMAKSIIKGCDRIEATMKSPMPTNYVQLAFAITSGAGLSK